MNSNVFVFFYGGLINSKLQERVGVHPSHREVAAVSGFELTIQPYVNLTRSASGIVYGEVMAVSHQDLTKLYGQLKVTYLPEAVLAMDAQGRYIPALCYIAPEMAKGQAEREHVLMLLEPAQAHGFPEWYLARIKSFLPPE